MDSDDWKTFTTKLKTAMNDEYLAVNREKNPFAKNLNELSAAQLTYALGQYTIFPKNIVSFLSSVRDSARVTGWTEVDNELTRNIGEELGTETAGTTHYNMLVTGLAEGIDSLLERNFRELAASPATQAFVDGIRSNTLDSRLAYAVGTAYALESSAVPELVIVQDAVNQLFKKVTGKPMQEGKLREFFRRHLDVWEPGHEDGLRNASANYITSGQSKQEFEEGFRNTMATMDAWWTCLYEETINHISIDNGGWLQ
ncbi:hypothetical protein COV18_06635 [Candidatus Woesearchaeota archaeon CG10_big_fil_rev_8_21_14_0_10_37_12]|nr:MAG: hypothetical protein COV18_06635 [Candidatus Woesearchaeota archaeon CG10_big_fil_rev_8_21_14_0_10_37_12]